ncbi:hypothetical protein ACSLBF_12775 [Pseudoalteromonas sp. T1lg65]|uniref:hypothetical protein n=1 Tax=Pseudoalteromonas sp. T1lg65 TaxID=2077101 RepID=UPI003F799963
MDLILSYFENVYNTIRTVFIVLLLLVAIVNRHDGHRVYMVAVIMGVHLVSVTILHFVTFTLIETQLFYSLMELVIVLMLIYRVHIIRPIAARYSSVANLFKNTHKAKQEYAIIFLYCISITYNLAMVIEHLIRHPYIIGFDKSSAVYTVVVYNSYTDFKIIVAAILVLTLFTMTVDGWVIRKTEQPRQKPQN